VAFQLLQSALVQNGDSPMTVTVLLIAAGRRDSSQASVSSSIVLPMGTPDWQHRLVTAVTTRAREGAVRLGSELLADQSPPAHRFVPLAAVIPAAHRTH